MTDRERAIDALGREGLSVTEWRDEPHATYDMHTHPQREVRIVLGGSMTIRVHDVERVLGPGDRIDIPPNAPHSAIVGTSGVHYLAGSDR